MKNNFMLRIGILYFLLNGCNIQRNEKNLVSLKDSLLKINQTLSKEKDSLQVYLQTEKWQRTYFIRLADTITKNHIDSSLNNLFYSPIDENKERFIYYITHYDGNSFAMNIDKAYKGDRSYIDTDNLSDTIVPRYSEYGYPTIVGWYYRRFTWHDRFIDYWPSKKDIALNYVWRSINRNPKNILKLFQEYEKAIYISIDKNFYDRLIKKVLKELLDSYEVSKQNGYFLLYPRFTKENSMDIFIREELYGKPQDRNFGGEPVKGKMSFGKDVGYQTWKYTFWFRRFQEGNLETVYNILKKIKNHYDDLK